MAPSALPSVESDIKKLQDESEAHFDVHPCLWQCRVALNLLAKKNIVSISAMGSGKTLTFWLPMLCEKGITFIVTLLKSLGSQLSNESIQRGFLSVSITAELLGEKPGLMKVKESCYFFSLCSYTYLGYSIEYLLYSCLVARASRGPMLHGYLAQSSISEEN